MAAAAGPCRLRVGERVNVRRQVVVARGPAHRGAGEDAIAVATGTFMTTELRPGAELKV